MRTKETSKQKGKIYFSKKIVFKKESQTIQTAIKDKQIQAKKKVIMNLLKCHSAISDELSTKKQLYQNEKEVYEKKYSQLQIEKTVAYQSLLKLKIRKFRLDAIENPKIKEFFANEIKKYLRSWAADNRYRFVKLIGGMQHFKIAQKFAWKLQMVFFIRPQIRKTVLLKHTTIFSESCRLQQVMIHVKKRQEGFLLQIYSTKGRYFHLERILSKSEYQNKVPIQNPLQNLLVNLNKKEIRFLDEYFSCNQNVKKIERILKIYRFQIEVLKQKKKIVIFKCATIRNIFQSRYNVPGYENIEIQVLLSIKKKKITKQNDDELLIYTNGLRKTNRYARDKAVKQVQQKTQLKYVFHCEPIRGYDEKYMFVIEDQNILKGYENNLESFIESFQSKFMIQLIVKKSFHKQQQNISEYQKRKKALKSNKNIQEREYSIEHLKPQIIKVIDFSSPQNLRKITKVQSAIKMVLARNKYVSNLKAVKKEGHFGFCCQIQGNIIISSSIIGEEIKYFVECLSLSAERKRQPNEFLRYPKKYWKLAEIFMNSQEIVRIRKRYLVWEIEEDISVCFEEIIHNYEQQQEQINLLKPVKAFNRLRRLFIRALLRNKRKNNTLYIKKVQKQFGTLVLILRKSPFLKNIIQAHLYTLKFHERRSFYQENQPPLNQKLILESGKQISTKKLTGTSQKQVPPKMNRLSYIICREEKNPYYQVISMFAENVHKLIKYMKETTGFEYPQGNQGKFGKISEKTVQSEFYITENYFILKPLHIQYITGQYKFIQRFASISLFSQQIGNQLENLSFCKNMPQSYVYDYHRTIFREKSILRGSRKSTASIPLDKSDLPMELSSEQEKSLIFYSLYKKKNSIFYLQLFMIHEIGLSSSFKQIHVEQISKKDISTSGWSLIYRIIANWAKNQRMFTNLQQNFNLDKVGRMVYDYVVSRQEKTYGDDRKSGYDQAEVIFNN